MELISVIVPVYKVEPYLNKCVESIVKQTYKNLEIILVDDGSPDNCPVMCDEWAKKDSRVKVIHKQNGGLSDARNAGMEVATGRYISFVDSDDWVHCEFLERLYTAIQETQSDISACDVKLVYTDEADSTDNRDFLVSTHTPEQAMSTLFAGEAFRSVVWNKLYRRDLLSEEKFEVGRYHEDEFFTYRIIDKCDKLAYVDAQMYYYLQRENSIMTTASVKHLDALEAGMRRLELFKRKYPELYHYDKGGYCRACVMFYRTASNFNEEDAKIFKQGIKKYRSQLKFSISEILKYDIRIIAFIIGSKFCIGLISKLLRSEG